MFSVLVRVRETAAPEARCSIPSAIASPLLSSPSILLYLLLRLAREPRTFLVSTMLTSVLS